MKVKKGGDGAGTGAEPAPGALGPSVEPRPEPQLQAESESGSESEPEAGPGPRIGPLQRKQPIGPDDVLGLQRITGGVNLATLLGKIHLDELEAYVPPDPVRRQD